VYALGCVLYQLLTGRPPFVSENPASVMFQHVQRDPIPPTDLRAELPSELEALTLWMLTKDPGGRPTAAELADGVRQPIVMMAETGMATTTMLAVRRKGLRAKFVAFAAIAAAAVPATVGILSGATEAKPPTTYDLNPSEAKQTAAPVAPSTSKTPAPTATRKVTHTTTSSPSKPPELKPSESKAPAPLEHKHVGRAGPTKHGTHGPLKPKKPKT
jgi:serine/threonine protein kinase